MIVFISFVLGIFIFSILLLILYPYGLYMEKISERIRKVSQIEQKVFVIDEDLSKPLAERFLKPMAEALLERFRRILPEDRTIDGSGVQEPGKLKKKLRQAGIRLSAAEYQAVRMIVILGLAILLGLISIFFTHRFLTSALFSLLGVYLGYVIMRFHLARRITARHESMRRQLPEVLDMLSVSVEAGLGLEQAILHVIEHYNGAIVDEISVTYREMSMGRTRREALLSLGERCEVDEINSFVRAIVQAGEMGISIKNVLKTQSASIRQSRKNKIEEKAMQVSVKILLPMAFFIFPVLFIVLLGPAVLSVYTQLFK